MSYNNIKSSTIKNGGLEDTISDYQKQFIKSGAWIDPTRITFIGAGLNAIGTAMMFFESTRACAPLVIGSAYLCDKLDGLAAKVWGLKTLEGAKVDPKIDKTNFIVPFIFFAPELIEHNYYLALAGFGINVGYNYLSDRFRDEILPAYKYVWETLFNIKNQTLSSKNSDQAVWSGKIKAGFQAGTIIAWSMENGGWFDYIKDSLTPEVFNTGFYGVLVPLALGIAAYKANENVITKYRKDGWDKTFGLVESDMYKLAFKLGEIGRSVGF